MIHREFKQGVFVLEGLNSFATTYYFYYFYFFMQKRFGFGDKANLLIAASGGLVCMFAAWWGGRFAQRAGYFTALKLGFGIMAAALLIGAQLETPLAHVAVMLITVAAMCLTWPTLEALVSEGERPDRLPANIGIYNVVWAGTGALAYFTGGALIDALGLGSMFYVPAAMFLSQLAGTFWLQRVRRFDPDAVSVAQAATRPIELNPRPISRARAFLRMAWFANPFGYIAINTLIAVMPSLAARLDLSTTLAGFCGSLWCFARLGAFTALWVWPGWHYRFRWLLSSYLALILSFAVMLTIPNLAVLITAQLLFGVALGLLYYSSLFYSMDVGDTKGEHGGIHEAVIGLGNFAGPAVGAASLHFLSQSPNSGTAAVSVLLLCGLAGLLTIWRKTQA
jgi:predicted MFS family arabinose efflux permease